MAKKWPESKWNEELYKAYLILKEHERGMIRDPDLKDLTQAQLAKKLGVSVSTLTTGLKNRGLPTIPKDMLLDLGEYLQIEQLQKAKEASLVFVDTKKAENPNWREFADLAETNQQIEKRTASTQRIATVKIETQRPIAIMFTSDWHLGDRHTDHLSWRKDIEFLLETPRLYMIDLGDDRQNARRFRVLANVLNQVLSPKQQALMMRDLIDEITREDKLLAKIGGNHDEEWDERLFGEAMQRYLCEKMKAPRFRNRGLIKLTVGETLYTLLVFHKTRFRSFLRRTHGAWREYELSYPADIVAGGHDHEPGLEHYHHYRLAAEAGMGFGGETYLVKTGTYQDSDYGWKYFHNGGFPANYTVILWPDQKKMQFFSDPKDAVQFMNSN